MLGCWPGEIKAPPLPIHQTYITPNASDEADSMQQKAHSTRHRKRDGLKAIYASLKAKFDDLDARNTARLESSFLKRLSAVISLRLSHLLWRYCMSIRRLVCESFSHPENVMGSDMHVCRRSVGARQFYDMMPFSPYCRGSTATAGIR